MYNTLLSVKKAAIYLVVVLLAVFPFAISAFAENSYAADLNQSEIAATQPDPQNTEEVIEADTDGTTSDAETTESAAAEETESSYLDYDQIDVPEIQDAKIDAQSTLIAKRETMDEEWLAVKQKEKEEAQAKAAAAEAAAQAKEAEEEAESVQVQTASGVDLGTFKLTAYCPCYECSRGWGRRTSSGNTARANHTIATDPSVIPEGTHVIINGQEYVAEDVGGGVNGNHIDIFYDTHSDAVNFGVRYAEVYLE